VRTRLGEVSDAVRLERTVGGELVSSAEVMDKGETHGEVDLCRWRESDVRLFVFRRVRWEEKDARWNGEGWGEVVAI
jgi:hypothetical protein